MPHAPSKFFIPRSSQIWTHRPPPKSHGSTDQLGRRTPARTGNPSFQLIGKKVRTDLTLCNQPLCILLSTKTHSLSHYIYYDPITQSINQPFIVTTHYHFYLSIVTFSLLQFIHFQTTLTVIQSLNQLFIVTIHSFIIIRIFQS